MPDRTARLLAPLLLLAALTGCTASPAEPAEPGPARPAASVDTGRAAALQDPIEERPAATSKALPTRIRIPSIDVDADLLHLARGADGVLQAPPADELQKAGWYAKGTVPGRTGPAVIAGHVDWVDRVAVFHRLGELDPGDRIEVGMSDGSTVRFTVDRRIAVEKDRFPTADVYGPTPDAQLRVITCGGPWDDARNIYSENVIVYATEQA